MTTASVALATPASAQKAGDVNLDEVSSAQPDGDILVVGQRRPVRADDVAGTVSISPASQLRATSTRAFEDLSRLDPSVQLSAYQGEMQLFVRGIGSVTFIGGFDTSVAVYANDVYLSRPAAISPAFFDLDHVEVLKGPQGSLYGRNANGGAVQLVSRGPSQDWEGEASLTVGNYNALNAFGAISGPIASDLTFRLAVGTNNHSGFTTLDFGRDPATGIRHIEHAEDLHELTGRLTLEWRPSDRVGLRLIGDYDRSDDRAVVFHFAGPGYGNNPLFLARLASGEVGDYGTRTIKTSIRPYNRPENWGISGRVWLDLPFGTLTSLTSYRRTHPLNYDDLSNSTVLGESQLKEERAAQISQDVFLSSLSGASVNYVAGFSYFRERNSVRNEYFFPYMLDYLGGVGTADCCLLKADGSTKTDAYAIFGEAELPIAGRLKGVLGGRWTHERRGGSNLLQFTGVETLNDAVLHPATFDAFVPKIGLKFAPNRDANIYATVSKGFKSGGFNVGSAQNTPYNPETLWSYEIGGNLRFAPLAARIQAAAFHYDYSNLQVQDVVSNSVMITNAANAKVDGIELSGQFDPVPGLTFEAAGTWLHARFSHYDTINLKTPELGLLNLAGNPLPQSPRWKGRVGAEYRFGVTDRLRMSLRMDALWQDRIWFSAFKDLRATQAAYAWLKARASLQSSDGKYELAVFADNLTNRTVFTNISITGDLDASRSNGQLAPPRTFGMQLSAKF